MQSLLVARQGAAITYVQEHVLPVVRSLDSTVGVRLDTILGSELKAHADRLDRLVPGDEAMTTVLSEGDALMGEVLAFLNGALARSLGLDDGLCAVAEGWLDDLSDRASIAKVGVVVPAQEEYLHTLAQVIRLSWPGEGVWALPIVIHEYGHFVAYQLTEETQRRGLPYWIHPVLSRLHDLADQHELPALYTIGHELFADAFATFVAGPSFAFACSSLRFDPVRPERQTLLTHPTPEQRMHVVGDVLSRMALSTPGQGWMAAAMERIEHDWMIATQGTPGDGEAGLPPELAELLDEFWDLLSKNARTMAMRYSSFDRAASLAARLDAPVDPAATIADVLNALWWRWDTEPAKPPLAPPSGDLAESLGRLAWQRLLEVQYA